MNALARAAFPLALLVFLGCAGLLAWEVVDTALQKVDSPVMFDRQGSSITDHAVRVHRGLPIYVEPDANFCPLLYTPTYYYLGAAAMALLGEGIDTMRILSLTLGTLSILSLGWMSWCLTRTWWVPVVSFLLAFTAYSGSRFYMDQPRVDTSSTFFLVLGLVLTLCTRRAWTGVPIALAFFLAFWTKQSVALFVALFLVGRMFVDARRTIVAGTVLALLVPTMVLVTDHVSDGWFWKMAVVTTGRDPFSWERLATMWVSDWTGPLLVPLVLLPPLALALWRRWRGEQADRALGALLWGVASLVLYTTLSRARQGGTEKTLMPLCLFLAPVLATGTWWAARSLGGRLGVWVRSAGVGALAWMCLAARFDPYETLPTDEDLRRWDGFVAELERYAQRGQVWPTLWGYLTTPMEGQAMRPTLIELNYYFGFEEEPRYPVPTALTEALARREFSAIFLPIRSHPYPFMDTIEQHYRLRERVLNLRVGVSRKPFRLQVWVPQGGAR